MSFGVYKSQPQDLILITFALVKIRRNCTEIEGVTLPLLYVRLDSGPRSTYKNHDSNTRKASTMVNTVFIQAMKHGKNILVILIIISFV